MFAGRKNGLRGRVRVRISWLDEDDKKREKWSQYMKQYMNWYMGTGKQKWFTVVEKYEKVQWIVLLQTRFN